MHQDEGSVLINEECSSESRAVTCVAVDAIHVVIHFDQWDHFFSTLHVVAWMVRFIHYCKTKKLDAVVLYHIKSWRKLDSSVLLYSKREIIA